MSDLKDLRAGIRKIDEDIINLVKQRLEISKEIGEIKAQLNLPVKNFKVEKELIERNEAFAVSLGLWPELAEDITKTLIRHSVQLQDEYQSERARANVGGDRKVCIIGGFGQMGQWLCEFFESFGDAVTIFDKPANCKESARFPIYQQLADVCEHSEIIVLATPITVTKGLIRQIADHGTKALVFDICSLKSPVLESIDYALARNIKICSVHPMFGPSVKLLSGRNILICETASTVANAESEAIFASTTAKVVKVPLEKHDKYMAYVLGLSHLTNLIFADVLQNSGITFAEMEPMASTTYNAMINVAEPVVNENESLYYEIQAHNNYEPQLLSEIASSFTKYKEFIESGNEAEFAATMRAARAYFNE